MVVHHEDAALLLSWSFSIFSSPISFAMYWYGRRNLILVAIGNWKVRGKLSALAFCVMERTLLFLRNTTWYPSKICLWSCRVVTCANLLFLLLMTFSFTMNLIAFARNEYLEHFHCFTFSFKTIKQTKRKRMYRNLYILYVKSALSSVNPLYYCMLQCKFILILQPWDRCPLGCCYREKSPCRKTGRLWAFLFRISMFI